MEKALPHRQKKDLDPGAYLRQPTPATGPLVVPVEVRLSERANAIRYRLGSRTRQPELRQPPPDLFTDFCRLADMELRPDNRISDFAAAYGVLGPSVARWLVSRETRNVRRGAEPISLWRRAARKTRALARLFVAMRDGSAETADDWESALLGETPIRMASVSASDRRDWLQRYLTHWCEATQPRHVLEWAPAPGSQGLEWRVRERIEAGTALGALHCAITWQLRLAIVSEKGLAVCSDCGNPYVPARKPDPNRERFCNECGLSGAWRVNKRNERARKRAAMGGHRGERDE